jgi:hypothetical protein
MTDEEWRPIPDWPGYEASSLGRVRSLTRSIPHINGSTRVIQGRVLRPVPDRRGYLRVNVHASGTYRTRYVHVLVLEAFVGRCPPGLEGCHGDGDHLNNTPGNLRWDTYEANRADMVRHGRGPKTTSRCPRGHEKSGPNELIQPSHRGRLCRACARAHGYLTEHPPAGDRQAALQELSDRYYAKIMSQLVDSMP